MPLLVLVVLLVVIFSCIELGVFPSPFSRILVRVRGGQILVEKGSLPGRAKDFLVDVLKNSGGARGFISVSSQGRVRFSSGIPGAVRQQVRNILLNQ